MSNVTFFVVILSIVLVGISEGCRCFPTHPQDQYCKSDFVIVGVPTSRNNDTDTKASYSIKIDRILKATSDARRALRRRRPRIYTSVSSAACGIELSLNERYLITGSVSGREAWTNTCKLNWLWNDMSREHKRAFLYKYKRGCSCNVVREFDSNINSPTVCVHNMTAPNSHCYDEFGVCLKNRQGICNWRSTTLLENCLNQ